MTGDRTYGQWWQTAGEHVEVPIDALAQLTTSVLVRLGANSSDAAFLAEVMLEKNLQGDHVRGVCGLADYSDAALDGRLDLASPAIGEIVRSSASSALLQPRPHASNVLACREAMETAIEKARATGCAAVGVSAYGGTLKPHMRQAVEAGMVGLALLQSYPTVAPLGAAARMLGNAPIGAGVPCRRHDPVLLDMSCTQSSWAGIQLAKAQGQLVPEGLILDAQGQPTVDPSSNVSLAVLGNSHKGYALVFLVGLLSAALTGTELPWKVDPEALWPSSDGKLGSVFIAIDPEHFVGLGTFLDTVDAFVDGVKSAARMDGADDVLYPGEMSQRLAAGARERGVVAIPRTDRAKVVELARANDLHALADALERS